MLLSFAATIPEQVAALAAYRSERLAKDAPAISTKVYERVAAGEIVTGVEMVDGVAAGKGWAVGIMDLHVERVWVALHSEDKQAGWFGLSESAVVEGDPRLSGRLVFQVMPLPIIADRWWIVREVANAGLYAHSGGKLWELAWTDATDASHLVNTPYAAIAADATPIGWTKGGWLLIPLEDGRTLAETYVWTDVGGSVPAGPASRFAGGALDKQISDTAKLAVTLADVPTKGFVRPDGTPL
jgi:hypothetical protein